ncbi:glycosyltransferase [candidate division WOR-3 bacterium]|nr:glycosyltransferase [candidate division WOR-3 bacterium]
MKLIFSLVLNNFDNDSRVIKINNLLSNLNNKIHIFALSSNHIKVLYKTDFFNKFRIYRINNQPVEQILFLPLRYLQWQFLNRFRMFQTIKQILMNNKCDIIYCNDFDTLILACLFKNKYKFKIVYDSHELWTERSGSIKTLLHRIVNKVEYILEYIIIKKANIVITVSDGIAYELSKRYNISKPYVIRNLDEEKPLPSFEDRMKIRDKLNIPHNCILLVYQGSLQESRGIPELIKAMDQLPNNIHLLLMGNFLSRKDLNKLKSNSRIHFPGMIPQEHLFNYTACADIGIAPIRINIFLSYKLAFPNKFSQYMNAGLALALYDIPESQKIIEKYDCGLVFEPGSSRNIIKAINDIIGSDKLEYYKRNSRKGFLNEYNWEKEKHKLLKIVGKI